MKFWRISQPECNSDYKHSYVNGSLEHPYGLPGVECELCGATWGGSRNLPFQCPESLRHHKNFIERWPVTRREHELLQHTLAAALRENEHSFGEFRPGDSLQPCFLDVPSLPRADFLWSSIRSLVVSERIRATLVGSWPDDVIACPVTLRKIGRREANLSPPIPSTGEPEDIIDEVPLCHDVSPVGPYFEILVQKESDYPPGGTPVTTCLGCGRPTIDASTRQIRMTPEMWKGDDIFFLATTLHVIVSDDVYKRLATLHPTNVRFVDMGELVP